MRAAIYCRISDDRDGKAIAVARQERECRALAKRLGWKVAGVYTDNSISAYSGKRRPEFRKMLADVQNGSGIEAIITWGADRLTRHPRELEDLVDVLNTTGVKVQTVASGEYDLTTADGRAYARIAGTVARQESEKKSERIKSQKAEAISKGEPVGGHRPFGWTGSDRAEVVPEEMAVLIEVKGRVLSGEGLSTIVNDLNRREIPTARGKAWTRAGLRQMLLNPATAGLREQPDGGVIEAVWKGAWDKSSWASITALLQDPARRTTHRLRNFLLTGLVYDPAGERMRTGNDSRGRIYRSDTSVPGKTGGASISAELVEDIVSEAVFKITDDLKLEAPEAPASDQEIEELERTLEDLAAQFGKGDLTAGEWNAAKGPLTARLKAARAARLRQAVVTPSWGKPGQLRREWPNLTIQQQREAIEVFVERVDIKAAKLGPAGVPSSRVSVRWKG